MSGITLRSGHICKNVQSEDYTGEGVGTPSFVKPKPITYRNRRVARTTFRAVPEQIKGEDSSPEPSTSKIYEKLQFKFDESVHGIIRSDSSSSSSSLTENKYSEILRNIGLESESDTDDSLAWDEEATTPVYLPPLPVEPLAEVRDYLLLTPEILRVPLQVGLIVDMAGAAVMKPDTFYGLSSEDGIEFMRLFRLYCEFHNVNLVEAEPRAQATQTADACRRFQLCISGDCASWFSTINPNFRWPELEAAFRAEYCNLADSWSENVKLRNIKQGPHQPVEVYIRKFTEQARRMGKDLNHCITDMVEGMHPEIRREVLLGSPNTVSDMIKLAKLAEIVCDRFKQTTPQNPIHDPVIEHTKQELISLVEEVKKLTKDNLASVKTDNDKSSSDSVHQYQNPNNRGNPRQPWRNSQNMGMGRGRNNQGRFKFNGQCYNCGIFGHRIADCRKPRRQNYGNRQFNNSSSQHSGYNPNYNQNNGTPTPNNSGSQPSTSQQTSVEQLAQLLQHSLNSPRQ